MFVLFFFFVGYFGGVNSTYSEIAYCPAELDCTWTYPYYTSQNLKCFSDSQCPKGFLCCLDCHYQHRVCKAALWVISPDHLKIQCPESTTYCKKQFPFLGTQRYQCKSNEQCDYGFLCCSDDCYAHKVCKKGVKIEEAESDCPEDLSNCSSPLPYETTKNYQCTRHTHCAESNVCCSDRCYAHKICKPRRETQSSNCPLSIRRKSCPNTNRTLPKYACASQDECVFGYICCEDSCYDHKVCKLPNEAFSYQSAHRSESSTLPSFDEQHKCPKVEEKCTKPYSLRLAKKFICFKDDDCKINQICCKDSCVKDFKICKNIFTMVPEMYQSELDKELIKALELASGKEFSTSLAPHGSILTSSKEAGKTVELSAEDMVTATSFDVLTKSSVLDSDYVILESETTTKSETEILATVSIFDDSTLETVSPFSDAISSTRNEEITCVHKSTIFSDREKQWTYISNFDESSLISPSPNFNSVSSQSEVVTESVSIRVSYDESTEITFPEKVAVKNSSRSLSEYSTPSPVFPGSLLETSTLFSNLTSNIIKESINVLDTFKSRAENKRKNFTVQSHGTEDDGTKNLKKEESSPGNNVAQTEIEPNSKNGEFYFDFDQPETNEETDHGSGSGDGFQDAEE